MATKVKLILDLGNSETRGIVLVDCPDGTMKERSFEISNRFAIVSPDYKLPADYTADTSMHFKMDYELDGKSATCYAIHGDAIREDLSAVVRPESTHIKKYNNITTPLSFGASVLRASNIVMDILNVPLNQLDIEWAVTALLPPADVKDGAGKLHTLFKSITEIEYFLPNFKMAVNVAHALVLPEAYCAFIGTVLGRGAFVNQGMENLQKEMVLVVDIGAGTTDQLIVENNSPISSTMNTCNIGGNNVTQRVRLAVTKNLGFRPDEESVNKAMLTGKIKDGSREIDITEYINKAKDEVAGMIEKEIRDFFEMTTFPIRNINKLLVCGGGSLSGNSNTNIKSMGDSLITYLKQRAPYIELVATPTRTITKVDANGVSQQQQENISPRVLNVLGASILVEGNN